MERHAVELFAHPKLVSTMKEVKEYWTHSVERSEDSLRCMEWAFEEVMFAALGWSLNQDPLYPRVTTITRLGHRLGDLAVPGTRWGIDNPDSVYRVIPISGEEKYVIRGSVPKNRVTENYFTLWDKAMGTVDVLNGKDLVLDADGGFEISVDSDPANGRPNHIQSSPEAHEFFIRDVLMDWKSEMINSFEVERLGDPATRPPRSLDEELELAAEYMWKWARDSDRWNTQSKGTPANQLEFKIDRASDGGLKNQIYIFGSFLLPSEDEALIVTVSLGGAAYFIAPITNAWGTTNFIQDRTGSLNLAQSVTNEDGTLSYVLSLSDPGVHNWLDPSDMHEGFLTLRWAEFENGRPDENLSATSQLVPLRDLMKHLPAGTQLISPEERRTQLAERADSYAWRLQDH
jgi:hypothetical protein